MHHATSRNEIYRVGHAVRASILFSTHFFFHIFFFQEHWKSAPASSFLLFSIFFKKFYLALLASFPVLHS